MRVCSYPGGTDGLLGRCLSAFQFRCALHPSFKDEKLSLSAWEGAYTRQFSLSIKYNPQ
jgi:hypothetical protein